MAGLVEIEGWDELRTFMRQATDALPRELTSAMRPATEILRARMIELAPKKTGALAASFRVYSNARAAGVKSSDPGAGVQEFARSYRRKNRSGAGTHQVTMHGGEPPRFGYKALDEVGDRMVEAVTDALVELLSAHGWLA